MVKGRTPRRTFEHAPPTMRPGLARSLAAGVGPDCAGHTGGMNGIRRSPHVRAMVIERSQWPAMCRPSPSLPTSDTWLAIGVLCERAGRRLPALDLRRSRTPSTSSSPLDNHGLHLSTRPLLIEASLCQGAVWEGGRARRSRPSCLERWKVVALVVGSGSDLSEESAVQDAEPVTLDSRSFLIVLPGPPERQLCCRASASRWR